ncbi:MAG: exosortase family protein XrtF [Cyclobacteriaceae bacterium]|nr:exosortase family protein XrtF [Cyclobacteriaceae bacterium]
MNLAEFKPTIFFLLRFLAFYLAANLIYGLLVVQFMPGPDPATVLATDQTAFFLDIFGWPNQVVVQVLKPTATIYYQGKAIVAVYEGCNGINVMIIFVTFLVAFGPRQKALIWFIPFGLTIIHVVNLLRIGLLFLVALYRPSYLYFSHKYFLTAILYGVVLILWLVWVRYFSKR